MDPLLFELAIRTLPCLHTRTPPFLPMISFFPNRLFYLPCLVLVAFSCSDNKPDAEEPVSLPPTVDERPELTTLPTKPVPVVYIEELDQYQEYFKEQHETSFSHVSKKNWSSYTAGKDGILTKVLLFGKHTTPLPALGGEYFQFMTSYADCVHGKTKDELKDKIVVRYYLMCDEPINYPSDMVYQEDGIGHEETSYHAFTSDGRYILAVKSFYAQTTITAYNAIPDNLSNETIPEITPPVEILEADEHI